MFVGLEYTNMFVGLEYTSMFVGLEYTSMFVGLEMEITISASLPYIHLMFSLRAFVAEKQLRPSYLFERHCIDSIQCT